MKMVRIVVVSLIALVAVFLIFVYSGLYNVAATAAHFPFTAWVLSTTMDHSVERHARGIQAPELNDPAKVALGYAHYNDMCAVCHGGPGLPRSEIAQGLNPAAPDLAEAADDWTPAQLFWIVKFGVKMSGMPAFQTTHTDDEIWAIVALVKRLPKLSPQEFGKMSPPPAQP
jgi:mono/diheme cytochrome c family protein